MPGTLSAGSLVTRVAAEVEHGLGRWVGAGDEAAKMRAAALREMTFEFWILSVFWMRCGQEWGTRGLRVLFCGGRCDVWRSVIAGLNG